MPIDADALSSLASGYTSGMTPIRGRRVQRLLKREFAGAEFVLTVQLGASTTAVLGLSASGAALCATDGRGPQVSVAKWRHGATHALEVQFDLLKDSLPALHAAPVPLAGLGGLGDVRVSAAAFPPRVHALVALALQTPA